MKISEYFESKCCSIGLRAKTKEDILRILAEAATKSSKVTGYTAADIYGKLLERESQGSTGFGEELAIPHARIDGMDSFLVFIGIAPKGVDFNALDNRKVKLFIVILGPSEGANEHVQILASISRTIGNPSVKNELIRSQTELGLAESFLRRSRLASGEEEVRETMVLLTLILYVEDFLYDILEYFIEAGIDGANITESFGMGEYISTIPLFASFIGFMNEDKNRSKTITALIPEARQEEIINGIEDITGDLNTHQGAMIVITDVKQYKGTMKMM